MQKKQRVKCLVNGSLVVAFLISFTACSGVGKHVPAKRPDFSKTKVERDAEAIAHVGSLY